MPGRVLADSCGDEDSIQPHPSYVEAEAAIDQKRYAEALPLLRQALAHDDGDANSHNLLGIAYRKTGDLDAAFRHYGMALRLNPGHRSAHEYIGEAYLALDDVPKAREHLRVLDDLCKLPCIEQIGLQKAIETHEAGGTAPPVTAGF